MSYAELHCRGAFSFLRGSSVPEEYVQAAEHHGVSCVALCDRMGVYGSARFHTSATAEGTVRAIVGAELVLEDAPWNVTSRRNDSIDSPSGTG